MTAFYVSRGVCLGIAFSQFFRVIGGAGDHHLSMSLLVAAVFGTVMFHHEIRDGLRKTMEFYRG